jgi:hypothetical protein
MSVQSPGDSSLGVGSLSAFDSTDTFMSIYILRQTTCVHMARGIRLSLIVPAQRHQRTQRTNTSLTDHAAV